MRRIVQFVFSIMLLILWVGCVTSGSYTYKVTPKAGSWLKSIVVPVPGKDFKGRLQIYFPKGYVKGSAARTLIVLHGHNGSLRDWETNTIIEQMADQYHIVLVCPAMGKSMYASQYFPETKNKWSPLPGGVYMNTVLIPFIRGTFNLAVDSSKTGIMGLSTGGRGALLTAARMPESFAAAAGVSGDYDPLSMTRNYLLRGIYGKYKDFKTRWEQVDNLMQLSINLKNVAVFLSHGAKDYTVPREQSMLLAMRLKQLQKKKGGFRVTYNEAGYGIHDWRYWRKVLPEMMNFFDENLKK